MIKVLMIAKAMEKTGVTSVMLSYYRQIDRTKVKMDFATGPIYEDSYKKYIEETGDHFWIIPDRDKKLFQYIRRLAKIIKENGYQIVHVHGNSAMIFPELMAAKLGGAAVRIAHSHNTMCNHPKLEVIARPFFNHYYTHALACSEEAGQWMFKSHPFTVISNGIDTNRYQFSEEDRAEIRRQLDVRDGELIIGHIGYFNYQKNHERLVDIFSVIHRFDSHTKLLLVGDGGTRPQIEKKIQEKQLTDSVILYGQTDEVWRVLSAMDVFVLPSHFEGFGIVLLEAQASGLRCVASSVVPDSAAIAARAVDFVSLDSANEVWADRILKDAQENRRERAQKSVQNCQKLVEHGFDTSKITRTLEAYYKKSLSERKKQTK